MTVNPSKFKHLTAQEQKSYKEWAHYLSDGNCTAKNFMLSASANIDLSQLYKLKDSLYTNEAQKVCPVLIEIVHEEFQKHYKAKFLLQVYTDQGNKIFEKALNNHIKLWNMAGEHLFYFIPAGEPDGGCLTSVCLKDLVLTDTPSQTVFENIKFQDTYKYMQYDPAENMVYISNQTEVFFFNLENMDINKVGLNKLQLQSDKSGKFIPGLKIWGMNLNNHISFLLESDDGVLDISYITLINKEVSRFEYSFTMYTERGTFFSETVNRITRVDHLNLVNPDEYEPDHVTVTHMEDQTIQIYRGFKLIDQTFKKFSDFYLHQHSILLRLQTGKYRKIPLTNNNVTRYASSMECEEEEFNNGFFIRPSKFLNLYHSSYLEFTGLHLAHGPFISTFNLSTNEWIAHTNFGQDVYQLFKRVDPDVCMNFGALLYNGDIYCDLREDPTNSIIKLRKSDKPDFHIEGEILEAYADKLYAYNYFIFSKGKDGKVIQKILRQMNFYNSTGFEFKEKESNIVYIVDGTFDDPIFIQNDYKVNLYRKSQPQGNFEELLSFTLPEECNRITEAFATDKYTEIYFFDEKNLFKVKFNGGLVTKVSESDLNCVNQKFMDKYFVYALCAPNNKGKQGQLRMIDTEALKSTGKLTQYSLLDVVTGRGLMDYNFRNERISILTNYHKMLVIPLLHRNALPLIGIPMIQFLMAHVVQDNYFRILLDNNKLISYNLMTSRPVTIVEISKTVIDLSLYELVDFNKVRGTHGEQICDEQNKGWYDHYVLQEKKQITEADVPQQVRNEMGREIKKQNPVFSKNVKLQEKNFMSFVIIKIDNGQSVSIARQFMHPIPKKGTRDYRMYVSKDMERMFEFQDTLRYYLYKWVTIQSNEGYWERVRRVAEYEFSLHSNVTYFPVLMGPNFKVMLEFDGISEFRIKDPATGVLKSRIPKHIMTIDKNEDYTTQELAESAISRFKWIDDKKFQFVDSTGFERIIDWTNGFTEEGFAQIPMFNLSVYQRQHYYFDPQTFGVDRVEERLKLNYKLYKQIFYIQNFTKGEDFLPAFYNIDYKQAIVDKRHRVDMPFTYLSWRIAEMLKDGKITFNEIDDRQMRMLLYSVFPDGNTILHLLADDAYNLMKFFQFAHPDLQDPSQIKYEVLYISNLEGKSPIDIALQKNNFSAVDVMLRYLAFYGIDHHSRAINNSLPELLRLKIPRLHAYIDTRIMTTLQTEMIKRGPLKSEQKSVTFSSYRLDVDQIKNAVFDKNQVDHEVKAFFIDIPKILDFKEQLSKDYFRELSDTDDFDIFEKKTIKKIIDFKYPLVREFVIKFLFLPYIVLLAIFVFHQLYTQVGLNEYEFEEDGNAVYKDRNIKNIAIADWSIMITIAVYFLILEVLQVFKFGVVGYFSDIWAYLDFVPMILVIVSTALDIKKFLLVQKLTADTITTDDQDSLEDITDMIVKSVNSLLLWFKLLFFMRIFEGTGYLINMLIQVVVDMRYFLLVLLITIIAFGNSYYTISESNDEEDKFLDDYFASFLFSYELALGNWDLTGMGNRAMPLVWILFILVTMFNTIIMLNLLIAIISETYDNVNQKKEAAQYQEKARIIFENSYLIPEYRRVKHCQKNSLLLFVEKVVTEMKDETADETDFDKIMYRLKQIELNQQKNLYDMDTKINSKIQELTVKVSSVGDTLNKEVERNKKAQDK